MRRCRELHLLPGHGRAVSGIDSLKRLAGLLLAGPGWRKLSFEAVDYVTPYARWTADLALTRPGRG